MGAHAPGHRRTRQRGWATTMMTWTWTMLMWQAPSGLHSESFTAQKMSQFSAFNTEMVVPYMTQGAKTAETWPSYMWNQERC